MYFGLSAFAAMESHKFNCSSGSLRELMVDVLLLSDMRTKTTMNGLCVFPADIAIPTISESILYKILYSVLVQF